MISVAILTGDTRMGDLSWRVDPVDLRIYADQGIEPKQVTAQVGALIRSLRGEIDGVVGVD